MTGQPHMTQTPPCATAMRAAVTDLFELGSKRLGPEIIRALIPVSETIQPGARINPTAFDGEMRELCRFVGDFWMPTEAPKSCLPEPIENRYPVFLTRIRTLLYCHILEADFPTLVILNLLRMVKGLHPCWVLYQRTPNDDIKTDSKGESRIHDSPKYKFEHLAELEQETTIQIGQCLTKLWHGNLRNAFSHSQYTIESNGTFLSTKHLTGASAKDLTKVHSQLLILSADEIKLYFDAAFAFFEVFFQCYKTAIKPFRNGEMHKFDSTCNIQHNNGGWTFTPLH